jgi:hypothetical protein
MHRQVQSAKPRATFTLTRDLPMPAAHYHQQASHATSKALLDGVSMPHSVKGDKALAKLSCLQLVVAQWTSTAICKNGRSERAQATVLLGLDRRGVLYMAVRHCILRPSSLPKIWRSWAKKAHRPQKYRDESDMTEYKYQYFTIMAFSHMFLRVVSSDLFSFHARTQSSMLPSLINDADHAILLHPDPSHQAHTLDPVCSPRPCENTAQALKHRLSRAACMVLCAHLMVRFIPAQHHHLSAVNPTANA